MTSLKPEDFATDQQIARNHARVSTLKDTTRELIAEDFALVGQALPAIETFAPTWKMPV